MGKEAKADDDICGGEDMDDEEGGKVVVADFAAGDDMVDVAVVEDCKGFDIKEFIELKDGLEKDAFGAEKAEKLAKEGWLKNSAP